MSSEVPLRDAKLILPLLSFGTGAADAFAFTALGGIFTANMTGNAVLTAIFPRADYLGTLAGAGTAIGAFAAALFVGFRVTRRWTSAGSTDEGTLLPLIMSAACLMLVVLSWWFAPHTRGALLFMIAALAAAMALQTVAAKRDGLAHGPTATYATGTLTDLMQGIAAGAEPWSSSRWFVLAALPLGAVSAVATSLSWPQITPVLPLLATLLCITMLVGLPPKHNLGDG